MENDKRQLISVIVPVYNVEKYLDRCLDSIRKQTYDNLEIILVDDGSADGSGQMCDVAAKEDKRIRVIHTPNGGLSHARNEGLEVARGDFIAFVDSDDYIHKEMFGRMLDTMISESSDMVICGIENFSDDSLPGENTKNELPDSYISVDKPDIFKCLLERDLVTVVQWNKLYKRRIFDDIRYPVGRLHEDVYVIHKELAQCSRITYLDAKMYFYYQRNDSIMHTESRKSVEDSIDGLTGRIRYFEDRNMDSERTEAVRSLLIYLGWKVEQIAVSEGYSELSRWLTDRYRDICEEYKDVILQKWINNDILANPKKFCKRKYWDAKRNSIIVSVVTWAGRFKGRKKSQRNG